MNSNSVLSGSLRFLGLGELLQLIGGMGSTGVIKLSSMHADGPGLIYCEDGNPIEAEYLDDNGIQVLNSFFGWLDAHFEFTEEPVLVNKNIHKGRMEIILDGLRMLDDGLIQTVGDSGARKPNVDLKDASGLPIIKGPLVDYLYIVDEDEFENGQEIVIQEKFGNWLWVILEGTVEVVRLMPEGQAPISKLSDGAFIGSITSLKTKSNVRSATVTAIGRVQLGVLDYHRILVEYSKLSEGFKEVLSSFDDRLKQVTHACANAVFEKLTPRKNMGDLKPFSLPDTADHSVLRIISGEAVVARKMDNLFIPLCTLAAGDFIGNIPFLNTSHEPHSAEVFVSEDFSTQEIKLVGFKKEYDKLSTMLKNMIQHTFICLSITTGRLIDILKKYQPDEE
ncbi:MAG: cyclic nucleotide-binding domain-containing protein [Desulfosalsimonadaceae bacterium]|nr:cyclic nucleotide-binding domain-containing protein [Desulfosalsimonadaceae bacterium]